MSRRFVFIGVTTRSSSIMRIFPRWRDALGLGADVEIEGWDIPIGAPPEEHRDAIRRMREEPGVLGALVTTHKIDVVRAARDLFDVLDAHAQRLGEVSAIARRDGRLLGWAKDPISAARALEAVVPPGGLPAGAEVLCLGAGGAASAIVEHLLEADGTQRRIVATDRDPDRLERLRERHGDALELVLAEHTRVHDELLAGLPPGSLVINATGMGKDRPGSPVSDAARFPQRAVVWELNYRGELDFLRQARAQGAERELAIEDGWRYFVHGWLAVMEEVFERRFGDAEVELLAREAEFARPTPDRR